MRAFPLAMLVLVQTLAGCSSQQLQHTGAAWGRSLCDKTMGDDRKRCEADAKPLQPEDRQSAGGR
ncbi:hypothetical protein [Azospirillum sp. B506]|uniref:hypothetical protein n=1 Tax=Azospirillum sp. B506 TaxID=137721 RepID=UPI0005B28B35|nr:hypothetical protein [Azospirillum sp. B506]